MKAHETIAGVVVGVAVGHTVLFVLHPSQGGMVASAIILGQLIMVLCSSLYHRAWIKGYEKCDLDCRRIISSYQGLVEEAMRRLREERQGRESEGEEWKRGLPKEDL